MSCEDNIKYARPAGNRRGLIIPASAKLEEVMYVGYKVKAKPVKYNAVFVDIKSTESCEENFSGWTVSVLGTQIFVPEEDMAKYFELIEEMEVPFEDELPPEVVEEYKKRKENKTEEVI